MNPNPYLIHGQAILRTVSFLDSEKFSSLLKELSGEDFPKFKIGNADRKKLVRELGEKNGNLISDLLNRERETFPAGLAYMLITSLRNKDVASRACRVLMKHFSRLIEYAVSGRKSPQAFMRRTFHGFTAEESADAPEDTVRQIEYNILLGFMKRLPPDIRTDTGLLRHIAETLLRKTITDGLLDLLNLTNRSVYPSRFAMVSAAVALKKNAGTSGAADTPREAPAMIPVRPLNVWMPESSAVSLEDLSGKSETEQTEIIADALRKIIRLIYTFLSEDDASILNPEAKARFYDCLSFDNAPTPWEAARIAAFGTAEEYSFADQELSSFTGRLRALLSSAQAGELFKNAAEEQRFRFYYGGQSIAAVGLAMTKSIMSRMKEAGVDTESDTATPLLLPFSEADSLLFFGRDLTKWKALAGSDALMKSESLPESSQSNISLVSFSFEPDGEKPKEDGTDRKAGEILFDGFAPISAFDKVPPLLDAALFDALLRECAYESEDGRHVSEFGYILEKKDCFSFPMIGFYEPFHYDPEAVERCAKSKKYQIKNKISTYALCRYLERLYAAYKAANTSGETVLFYEKPTEKSTHVNVNKS